MTDEQDDYKKGYMKGYMKGYSDGYVEGISVAYTNIRELECRVALKLDEAREAKKSVEKRDK